MVAVPSGASGVGRPRSAPRQRPGSSAREEILDAAAELFSEQGYAGTSTRAIAMAVGIKQASLYYHFDSKERILSELLALTVGPSLDAAGTLADRPDPTEAKLWALAGFDARLLCSGRWNLGALFLLPELRSTAFTAFHRQRQHRRSAYSTLIAAGREAGTFSVADPHTTADLVFGLVESVVPVRQERGPVDADRIAPAIADGCLRLLSCPPSRAAAARRQGAALLELLTAER
jgi:AcrR family transcriptional regulator